MTVEELKRECKSHNPDSHFFDSDTLKFFGDSKMYVLKGTAEIVDIFGEKHTCYVLSTFQKNFPFKATRRYHYFDVNTFEHITGK